MAKEGFDWQFCEHALTIGYRGSLTEIVQIVDVVHEIAQTNHMRSLPILLLNLMHRILKLNLQ
nr:hypothetical protein [Acinetobacter baumannii]